MKYFLAGIIGLVSCISAYAQTEIEFGEIPTSGTVLVNAHMDDDLIFMLPFWNITDKFVGGAMPSTADFNSIIHEQQIYLNGNGYSIDYESNWYNPWGLITDNEYAGYYWYREPAYNYLAAEYLLKDWDDNDPLVMRTEIDRIKAKIERYIAVAGVSRIITHNNWGEYGHQHHKAINKAVRELAVKYRKDVWMLGCTVNVNTDGSFNDISIPGGVTYALGSFNATLYSAIKNIYSDYGHWTGPSVYTPDGDHPFIKIVDAGNDLSNTLPDNLFPDETITLPGPYQDRPGAYVFDGVDDYMTLSSNQNSSFTVAMWIRPEEIKPMDISMMAEFPSSEIYDRSLYLNANGTVSAKINDGTSKTITSNPLAPIPAGDWTHIAMTSDGTSLKIFINGVGNTVAAGLSTTTYITPEFVLGQAKETSSFFNGQISEVQLFDYSLSDAEILSLAGTPAPAIFTIGSSSGIGGTITPLGDRMVVQGTSVLYNITPEPFFTTNEVIVDGVSQGSVGSYTFTNVSENHTIQATFSSHVGNIALNKSTSCQSWVEPSWPSSKANDEDGSNESLWAANGSNPQWWKVDLGSVYDVTHVVIRNKTNSGVLNGRYYYYTIQASIDDVTYTQIAEKNNNNIATDAGDYYDLSTTARYLKVNILYCSDGNGAAISDFRAYGTINSNFSIISSNAGIWGLISPSGELTLQNGTDKTFIITPDFGYQISDVKVDNTSVGAVAEYTFYNISENHSIVAEFSSTMQNIALNKETTCQSIIDPYFDSSKANDEDGSNNSIWAAEPFPQWWEVDLGSIYDISYLVIRNLFLGSRFYHYYIEASIDNLTWTEIAAKEDDNIATDKGDVYIITTTARYLRVTMQSCSDGEAVAISDFRVYGTRTPGLWMGGTSSDWNTTSNWNDDLLPTSSTNVIVASSSVNQPVISGPINAVCNNLTINSGASVTISPNGSATMTSVTNNGILRLNSSASGIASLMLDTYNRGTGGAEEIQLYLTGGMVSSDIYRWHYISSPVTPSIPASIFEAQTLDLARFVEGIYDGTPGTGWIGSDGYIYITGLTNQDLRYYDLMVGKGYNFYDDPPAGYETFTFGGLLNTSPQNISLEFSGSFPESTIYGFNLLGNPFTCGFNWDVIANSVDYPALTSKAIFFTKNDTQYTYANGVGVPSETNGHVPPMQGFFVKTYSTGNTLTIPLSAREHNHTERYKGTDSEIPLVRLSVKENNKSDETVIRFDNHAKSGIDFDFDAVKMSGAYQVPSIFSLSGNTEMTINGLPFPDQNTEIPINITVGQTSNGNHTIKAAQLQGLDNYLVLLTDKRDNISINLKTNPNFTFAAPEGSITNRFVLKVGNISTGIEDPVVKDNRFNIYSAFGYINVQTLSDEWEGLNGSIKISDLTGKTISNNVNQEFSKGSIIQIPAPDKPGIIIIELRSGMKRFTGKVIIK